MSIPKLCAAAVAVGTLALAAHAQPPAIPAAPQAPKVIQWPGGYLVMNGPEVIVRNTAPGGGSTNVITGSGNGFGNKIVVDGGVGGLTIVKNARNGIGNKLVLNPDDVLLDLDAILGGVKPAPAAPVVVPKPAPADPVGPPAAVPVAPAPVPAPAPAVPADPPSYKGKASPFWTHKEFSDAHDCNLYWCPTTKLWFRYGPEDDTYRPVPTQPAPPAEKK